jgi:hypothetical protein
VAKQAVPQYPGVRPGHSCWDRFAHYNETHGTPVCPSCGSVEAYEARRQNGALRFRCKGLSGGHCRVTLALSRDLGLSYKSAFVLLHKLREAMAEEMKGRVVVGEGKTAEVDGGYFGGYVKPANVKAHRRDRRLSRNQAVSARLL